MTARDDVLRAARALRARGLEPFAPADVVAEVATTGSTYAPSTIRTHVVAHMRRDRPAAPHSDLERVGPGRYRLVTEESTEAPLLPAAPREGLHTELDAHWTWEGNVQAAVVQHLLDHGTSIIATADTANRQQGLDIEAEHNGRRMLVEVKGYPSRIYARGPKRGQSKPTQPATQARHWFSAALLSAALLRGSDARARVAMAFPDLPTYRSLAERCDNVLQAAAIEVWFVDEEGAIDSA